MGGVGVGEYWFYVGDTAASISTFDDVSEWGWGVGTFRLGQVYESLRLKFMALIDTYNLRYTSETMKSRVTAAVAQDAADILNEDPGTPNHENRKQWAEMAMANSPTFAENAMWTVVMNPTINAAGDAASDQDILFVVSSWINDNIPAPPPTA